MEFKVGDIVRISNLVSRWSPGLPHEYPNELFRIVHASKIPFKGNYYQIEDILTHTFEHFELNGNYHVKVSEDYTYLIVAGQWNFYEEDLELDIQSLRENKLKEIGI